MTCLKVNFESNEDSDRILRLSSHLCTMNENYLIKRTQFQWLYLPEFGLLLKNFANHEV